jgi:Winged helix-turn helix
VDAGAGLRADRPPLRHQGCGETAGRYLRTWGFSPQKPARRALEQNPEVVARWLEERYPEIEKRAHRERARILWADEMGLRSDHTAGRFGANVISAISNKGHLQFRVFKERFTAPVFIDFLGRLVRQAGGRKMTR